MAELAKTSLFGDANLQAYWKMDGDSTDAKNSNDGTDANMTYAAGVYGSCAVFNGSNGKIDFGNILDPGTGSFSFVCWIYLPSTGNTSNEGIYTKMSASAAPNYPGFQIATASTTSAYILLAKDGGDIGSYNPIVWGADDAWHHFGITVNRSASEIKAYKDGVQLGTTQSISEATTIATTATLRMGVDRIGTAYMEGKIDDAAHFDRVLTDTEILILAKPLPGGNPMFFSGGVTIG